MQNININTFVRNYKKFNLIFVLIIVSAVNNFGQMPPGGVAGIYTPPSFATGTPSGASLSELESIHPNNGNLNFVLPLYSFGGRGEVGYTQNLVIEKNWSVNFVRYYSLPGTPHSGQPGQYSIQTSLWNEPGVSGPGVLAGRKSRQGGPEISANQCFTLTTITWKTNDKTEYELRDEQTDGQPAQYGSLNRGTVFKSHDGSNLRFIADQSITDVNCGSNDFAIINGIVRFTPSGYLYFPNGIKYRVESGYVAWMEDRNGNHLAINGKDVIGRTPNTFGFAGVAKSIIVNEDLLANRLRPDYTAKSAQELFPNAPYANGGPPVYNFNANPNVVSEAVLPNGTKYEFFYNSYGELAKVILPTGGVIEYDFGPACFAGAICPESGLVQYGGGYVIKRIVRERRLYKNNGVLETKIKYAPVYSPQGTGGSATIEVFDGDNQKLSKTVYYYHGGDQQYWYPTFNAGKEYKREIFDGQGNLLQTINTIWDHLGWDYRPHIPYVREISEVSEDTGQVKKTTYQVDSYGNISDIKEYDYGNGQSTQFLRRTHTDYLTTNPVNNTNYTANGIYLLNLPSQTWVSSDINGNNKVSFSQYEYDNYSGTNRAQLSDRNNVIGHNSSNFGSLNTIRGNVTSRTNYENAQNQTGGISTFSQYDILGNIIKKIDAKNNISKIYYDDNFGSPDGDALINSVPAELQATSEHPTLNTFAFPTSATNALNWIIGYSQFDFYTGQSVDVENIHGVVNSTFYNDPLDRPTQIITANNLSAFKQQTSIVYDDANRRTETKSDLNFFNDNLIKVESYYDKLGRTTENREYESDGGYIVSKTEFDGLSRVKRITNPYRPLRNEASYWTESFYDSLDRIVKIKTPDNAEVTTSYFGNASVVTDQSGKKKRHIINGIGQLIRVDESNDAGLLDVNGVPAQPTNYEYDALGNLITVNQGTQTRTFLYDSLSRLKQATDPESGTISNSYDENGNLKTKRDSRGIKTVYDYDNLNRITKRCYRIIGTTASLGATTCASTNETIESSSPEISYTYDDISVYNSKGKLTSVTTGSLLNPFSETKYLAFDVLGNITSSQQITDGVTYNPMSYSYNLSGSLIEETYPSGRVVKTTLDNDGNLSQVQSRKAANTFKNYANSFGYSAWGALGSVRIGNGRFESTQFNARMQPVQIGLGSSISDTNLLKLNFDYGTTDNNGNIKSQKITVPTTGNSAGFITTQIYLYDSLNRIKQATETIAGQTNPTWQQTFNYDRYGNRNFDESNTTTLPKNCGTAPNFFVCASDIPKVNPIVNLANNRLNGTNYDNSGNTVNDANGQTFVYDAENRIVQARNANNQIVGTYFYDGDGKRVKKITNTETTMFVYNIGGQPIAEYSTQIEQNPQIKYLTSDMLGSPRIITNQLGQVVARHDYMPFGEDAVSSQRTQTSGYQPDSLRQKFAGLDKDDETNLNFVEARYYSSNIGRFTTSDPIKIKKDRLLDPQRINLYVYVRNNPLIYTDSSGEDLTIVITNVVVGTQTITVDGKSTEVPSYRVVIKNESGTERTFETTRDPSNGKRGNYDENGETPPGKYAGDIRGDGKKGFRIEFRDKDQPKLSGRLKTPTGYIKLNAQLHRCAGLSDGCPLFPKADLDRFEKTIRSLLAEDKENGYGEVIEVTITPRNPNDNPSGRDQPSNEARNDHERNGKKPVKTPKPPKSPYDRPIPLPVLPNAPRTQR